jgi:hypothetical protein
VKEISYEQAKMDHEVYIITGSSSSKDKHNTIYDTFMVHRIKLLHLQYNQAAIPLKIPKEIISVRQKAWASDNANHPEATVKIAYIASAYPPRIGGVEYVVKSVAERLAKAHEVTVVVGEPTRAAKLVVKRPGPPQIPKTIVL